MLLLQVLWIQLCEFKVLGVGFRIRGIRFWHTVSGGCWVEEISVSGFKLDLGCRETLEKACFV